MRVRVLSLTIACMLPAIAFGSDMVATTKTYLTRKVNPHPPVIDGALDDEVWHKVDWAGDFTQRSPEDGAEPSQETRFKILYDEHNLYVGIQALDGEPEKIVKRVSRRDRFEGDWVEINIDSYFDHRTAFSFTINAAGVKGDEAISNDGDNWDSNWNPIWYADVHQDAQGWSAEMRIPFNQLRFASQENQTWGIQVSRRLFRKEELSVWQYIKQNAGGWVSFFGELKGLQGIKPSRRLELLPYGVTTSKNVPGDAGDPFATNGKPDLSAGLDAKLGVTSDLTLDLTVNPDFGQVEADPSEVNLTAFETFFPEKRPFFIEGKSILEYPLMIGDGGFSSDRLFYSRRIGRQPHYSPDLQDGEYMETADRTSILTAAKLTGRTRSGLSVGVLEAVTDPEHALIDFNGQRRQETVEPRTNYFVGRLQQDFDGGNTSLGGMLTATNRDISAEHLNFIPTAAYTGGADFRHQWGNKTYYVEFKTSFSHIRGSREAIREVQESSARYYQRPDADYVELDTTRTSLTGHGGYFAIGKGGNSKVRYMFGTIWRSPGLELNDIGFLRTADRVMQWTWAGANTTKPVGIFRQLRGNFNQWWGWNFGGETVFAGGNVNGGGQFKNHWFFWMGVGYEGMYLSTAELRGGPAIRLPGGYQQWASLSSDERKAVEVGIGTNNGWNRDRISKRNNINFWLSYRPKDAVRLTLSPFYNFNRDNLQYISTESFNNDDRYLFGRLSQKTLGLTLRLDYSITPDLSIQYYGQPFISAGRYSHFKRITSPRADNYDDRFQNFTDSEFQLNDGVFEFDENNDGTFGDYSIDNPDFNFRQFRSNLVVRWEYSPGSTIFLVWTQERTSDTGEGRFALRNDFNRLFEEDATNVFLVKVSRWFSF